jgi:hypothetical protein
MVWHKKRNTRLAGLTAFAGRAFISGKKASLSCSSFYAILLSTQYLLFYLSLLPRKFAPPLFGKTGFRNDPTLPTRLKGGFVCRQDN